MSRHGAAVAQVEAASAPVKARRRGGMASWPIRRKLVALVAAPLVLIVGAGALLTTQAYGAWRDAVQAGKLSAAAVAANTVVTDGNNELLAALTYLRTPSAPGTRTALTALRKTTDADIAALGKQLSDVPSGGWSPQVSKSLSGFTALPATVKKLRDAVDNPTNPISGQDLALAYFGPNLQGLQGLTNALATDLAAKSPNAKIVDGAVVLSALASAAVAASVEAVTLTNFLQANTLPADAVLQLQESKVAQTDLLNLAASRPSADKQAIAGIQTDETRINQFRADAIAKATTGKATPNEAATFSAAAGQRLQNLDLLVSRTAQSLQDQASTDVRNALIRAALVSGVALAALILVSLFVAAIARTVTVPMRRLRSGAVDAATVRLPAAVRQIEREGPDAAVSVPPVLPADARVGPETREVAQALDGLTGEAVRLATAQVRLRQALDEAFVSMSRRSQSMVEKQLAIIDELESTEEDPEQLRNLFRLDHLAARMRRYNDNLLVLAGSTVRTRSAAPVPIADVFRAATSEMEQYERVRLQPLGGAMVTGAAAGGLIHLLAELLDNAAMYSPPTSPIVLSAAFTQDGGLHLEVTDSGVGIPAAELSDLNARLAMPGAIDTQVPSRMGLFVVARLAQRGGLAVRLAAREHSAGTVAEVSVPSALVIGSSTGPIATGPAPAMATPAEPPRLPVQQGVTPTPLRGVQRPAAPRVAAAPRDPANASGNGSTNGAEPLGTGAPAGPGGLPSRRPGAALAGNPLGTNPLAEPAAASNAPADPFPQTRAAHAGSLGGSPAGRAGAAPSAFESTVPWSDRANRTATPGSPPPASPPPSSQPSSQPTAQPPAPAPGLPGSEGGRLPRRAPGNAPPAMPFSAPGHASDWSDPRAGRGAFEPQTGQPSGPPAARPAAASNGGPGAWEAPSGGPSGPQAGSTAGGWATRNPVRGPGQAGGGPALGPSAATAAAAAASARNRGPISPPTSGLFAATGPLTRGPAGGSSGQPSGPLPQAPGSAQPSQPATARSATPAAPAAPTAPSGPSAPVAPSGPAAPSAPSTGFQRPPGSPAPGSPPPGSAPAAPQAGRGGPLPTRPVAPADALGSPAPAAAPTAPPAQAQAEPLPMEQAARQAAAAAVARYRPIDPHAPMIGAAGPTAERAPTPIFDSISVWFSDDRSTAAKAAPAAASDPARVIDLRDPANGRSGQGRPAAAGPDRAGSAGSQAGASAGSRASGGTRSGAPAAGGPESGGPAAAPGGANRWAALGDQRWVATNARASAAPATAGSTQAGLPVRRPGANLLPSAATAAAPTGPALPARRTDAESVRGRLGSYQRGLSSARRARHLPADTDAAAPFNPPPNGESSTGRRSGGQGGDS